MINKKFLFSHIVDYNIPIYSREYGEVAALYDTYVYNESMLSFKTNSRDNTAIYRLILNTDGKISFRPIGYIEHHYNLYINSDGSLLFKEITI